MPRKKKDKNDKIVFAWLAVFLTIIGFVIALILRRDDKYVMYYAKQGLVLFLGFVIASLLDFIPVLGLVFTLSVFILWVLAWVNALSGKRRRTWIIQDLAEKIKL